MAHLWAAVQEDPTEREAFFSLLDEYFARNGSSTPTPKAPRPSYRSTPPPAPTPTPSSISSLTTVPPPTSLSGRVNNFTTSHSNAVTNSALQNTAATSSALRSAGLSPGAANAASKFGASHSTILAPHLASAATGAMKDKWASRTGGTASPSPPSPKAAAPPVKGPKPPAGLSSSKSIAGGFSTESKKDFGKSLFSSKGPMSNEEAKKNAFKEPLATKPAPRVYGAPTASHAPPPVRRAAPASPVASSGGVGMGGAEALYDYEGSDPDDLPVREGESLTIIEKISDDWRRVRNSQGSEGLVPTSYIREV